MVTVVVGGHGDITDPEAWQDVAGNVPPAEYSNVPYNVNYPLNGDGRYWFQTNAFATNTSGPITFIGNPTFLADSINLQWSIVQAASDGSQPFLAYSLTTGTWTTATLTSAGTQLGGIQNGQIIVPFTTASTQI